MKGQSSKRPGAVTTAPPGAGHNRLNQRTAIMVTTNATAPPAHGAIPAELPMVVRWEPLVEFCFVGESWAVKTGVSFIGPDVSRWFHGSTSDIQGFWRDFNADAYDRMDALCGPLRRVLNAGADDTELPVTSGLWEVFHDVLAEWPEVTPDWDVIEGDYMAELEARTAELEARTEARRVGLPGAELTRGSGTVPGTVPAVSSAVSSPVSSPVSSAVSVAEFAQRVADAAAQVAGYAECVRNLAAECAALARPDAASDAAPDAAPEVVYRVTPGGLKTARKHAAEHECPTTVEAPSDAASEGAPKRAPKRAVKVA